MIDIKEYNFEKNYQESFLDFMKELYARYNYAEGYINYIKKLIDPVNPSFKSIKIKNFIAYSDKKTVGHISAITDTRLVQGDNPIGILGFYECTDNNEI